MKQTLISLRFLVISPEFFVLFSGLAAAFACPDIIASWLSGHSVQDDVVKYVALLPLASTTWLLTDGRGLLFPTKDERNLMQQWPDYWKMKCGFNVALLYSVLFSVLALVAWGSDWTRRTPYPQITMLVALLGAGANFLSCYYARITIDEMFARPKS